MLFYWKMTKIFFNSNTEHTFDIFEPLGDAYKGDAMTLVFSWLKKVHTAGELVCILLGDYSEERLCISQPVNISQMSHVKHPDDIKCDVMGSWKHNGSPKHCYCITKSTKRDYKYPIVKNEAI
jgi:hypothetical protein